MASPPVYLDTCVILAACRARCWRALMGAYALHTTGECRRELTQGNQNDPKYVSVDMEEFDRRVHVHVNDPERVVAASLEAPVLLGIDEGERDLLAWCQSQPDALLLSTGDRAAVRAACCLGLQDRLVSLEELLNSVGQKPKLPSQFTRAWLAEERSKHLLERNDL